MSVAVGATLQSNGTALPNALVRFTIGSSTRTAMTNGNGVATAQVPLIDNPGTYQLQCRVRRRHGQQELVRFEEFVITKLGTSLALGQTGSNSIVIDTGLSATLTSGGSPVSQKTVGFLFTPSGGGAPFATTRITDGNGRATTGAVTGLPPVGVYTVQAFFANTTNAPLLPLTADAIYGPSTSLTAVAIPTHRLQHYGPDRVLSSSSASSRARRRPSGRRSWRPSSSRHCSCRLLPVRRVRGEEEPDQRLEEHGQRAPEWRLDHHSSAGAAIGSRGHASRLAAK